MGREEQGGGGAICTTPLLASSPSQKIATVKVEKCPGCRLQRRKATHMGAPKKELCILALIMLASALPMSSLFPFLYYMVRDFNIAKSDTDISTYAGYIGSALMFGRFLTSAVWGIVADRYGRKPVLIIGTASIVFFNTIFGFSSTFWPALVSRFLLGIWNGMVGTVSAYASEICREEHQPLGLSVVSTMWAAGLVFGPAIGGYLAQPAEKYPTVFPSGSLFDKFPYALPCVCISVIALLGFGTSFWLPESLHNHPLHCSSKNSKVKDLFESNDKTLSDESIKEQGATEWIHGEAQVPLWRNKGIVAAITVYCLWGLHDMAYSEVFSLWAVTPELYGGLAFSTSQVGTVLSVTGAALLVFQLLVFPAMARKYGAIHLVQIPAGLTIPLVAVYPLFVRLSGAPLWTTLISASIIKNVLSACVVTGSFLLINNAVLSAQKGLANGVAMSLMSLFRAFGPASAGALLSWSEQRLDAPFLPGMWTVFTTLDVFCFIAFLATLKPFLSRSLNKAMREEENESEQHQEQEQEQGSIKV